LQAVEEEEVKAKEKVEEGIKMKTQYDE